MVFQEKISTIKAKLAALSRLRPTWKQVAIVAGAVVGLVVVVNLAMAWYYQNHYYPRLKVGDAKVGNLTPARARQVLADRVDRQPLVLSFQDKVVKIPVSDLGISYNLDQTLAQLDQYPKPVIPLMFWLSGSDSTTYPLLFKVEDEAKFTQKLQSLIEEYASQPLDAKLEIADGQAKITSHRSGAEYSLETVRSAIEAGLGLLSSDSQAVPFKEIRVKVTDDSLKSALDQARQMIGTQIKLTFDDKQYSPSRSEIGSWLEVNDQQKVVVSEALLSKYIEGIAEELDIPTKNEVITTLDGIETGRESGEAGRSLNRTETSKAILEALNNTKDVEYALKVDTVEPTVEYIRRYTFSGLNYSYCVQANGVDGAMLGHFSQKISSTLSDARGWGMDGRIRFSQVNSGCSFNLVLAAASTLPAYSSACSIYWSCRVGSNVIINVDRWTGASDSWNQAGGSLDEYQSMVINHEVGHWLGFDHWSCGGSGQQAPVMLQQSIDLQGCTFNAWPSAAELSSLRASKGI